MRAGAQDLYRKVQAKSRVPQLEKEVMEAKQKLFKLVKERNVLTSQVKKVPQLEAKVGALKHSIALQCNIHQAEAEGLCAADKLKVEQFCSKHSAELELKDAFCEAKKVRLLTEL